MLAKLKTAPKAGPIVLCCGIAFASGAHAGEFEPHKYFRDAESLAAIASATARIQSDCKTDLKHSEEQTSENGETLVTLSVECSEWLQEDGKTTAASVQVIFLKSADRYLTPLEFVYNIK